MIIELLQICDNIKGKYMNLSYNKLRKILIDKGMKKIELRQRAAISTASLAKLGKNEAVNLEVLFKICCVLDCNIGDIVEFIK